MINRDEKIPPKLTSFIIPESSAFTRKPCNKKRSAAHIKDQEKHTLIRADLVLTIGVAEFITLNIIIEL